MMKRKKWVIGFVINLLFLFIVGCQGKSGGVLPFKATAVPSPTPIYPATAVPVTEIALEKAADGLRKPVYAVALSNDRFLVAEQPGRLQMVVNGRPADDQKAIARPLPEPFLDITEKLATDGSERGLLGLALHPDYAENGRFFIVYTNPDGDTIIAEYARSPNPNLADPDSEKVLFLIDQPYGNHNGGQLLFGPDGFLYIGLGDGGAVGDPFDNAQNPGTLLGAILRVDVDGDEPYAIPVDNPFVGQAEKQGEVWAYGLRNPWSFRFDRLTGDLYIADVGQEGPEEINFHSPPQPAGVNYGWPILEGTTCFEADRCDPTGFTPPIFEYAHSEGCAVIGGPVYRGLAFPELTGNYLFADFCRGTLWTLVYAGDGRWQRTAVYEPGTQISAIIEDEAGEVYVLFLQTGEIHRVVRP